MWQLNKIPKVIHFYWGGKKLSYLRFLSILSFRKLNPDWVIKVHIPSVVTTTPPAWDTMHQKNSNIGKDYFKHLEKLNVEIVKQDFADDFDNDAQEVHFRVYFNGRGTGAKYVSGSGYITNLAPTVNPTAPVWVSPITISVNGDFTVGTV